MLAKALELTLTTTTTPGPPEKGERGSVKAEIFPGKIDLTTAAALAGWEDAARARGFPRPTLLAVKNCYGGVASP